MTSGRSWEVPDGEAVLTEAVEHYGERVLSDPHLLDNFLSDVLPDDPASARLLVLTAEHDLAGSLRNLFPAVGTDEAIRVASQRFVEAYPVDRDAALWATLAVAAALGQGTTTPARELSAEPAPTPSPAPVPPAKSTVWHPVDAPDDGAPPTRQQPIIEPAPAPPRPATPAYPDPVHREPVPPGPAYQEYPAPPAPAYQESRYQEPTPAPAPAPAPWAPPSQGGGKKRSPVIIAAIAGVIALISVGIAGAVIYSRHNNSHTTSPTTIPTTSSSTTTPASSTTSTTVPKTTTTTTFPVATAASVQNATGAQQVLARYFSALNSADWQGAYNTLGPDEQAKLSPTKIAQGSAGTKDAGVVIEALSTNADGSLTATVSFQSMQPASSSPNNSTCDNWDLEYTLTPSGSSYLIDKVASVSNPPYSSC